STPPDPTQLLFFAGNHGEDGVPGACQLWASNGSAAGTRMVKDIRPGACARPSGFAAFQGRVFFAASDDTHGEELWASDGTADGTTMVVDLRPGPEGAYPSRLVRSGDWLYFLAVDDSGTIQLWRSDGTAEGSTQITETDWGDGPRWLVASGGALFFSASLPGEGYRLWRSDGTAEGTKSIAGENWNGNLADLTDLNGTLFFAAPDADHGRQLWKSDGTEKGTERVTTIAWDEPFGAPRGVVALERRVYFVAARDGEATRLWVSDGTAEGTQPATDDEYSLPWTLAAFEERLLFLNGGRLGLFDPEAGTGKYLTDTAWKPSPIPLGIVDGAALFAGDSGEGYGRELWRTDGTQERTEMVDDLCPGACDGVWDDIS
ncbi:MAG TPA: ELWxxDGT repeat protein, partial [Arenicellales bacterium]|nr:ELWxxDGT repeat protein [Arenicellales bacterium]